MKRWFSRLALAALMLPALAVSASAETQVVRYNGHLVTVQVTLRDPECGDKGYIIESPYAHEIGVTVTF